MMYLSSHFCKVKQNLKVDNIMIERSHGVISEDVWSSRKKPASARHLTVISFGRWFRKLSQCIRVANPPAEHPERRACLALDKPRDKSSSINASHISWPLKKSLVVLFFNSFSGCPAKDAPSQYRILTLFQLKKSGFSEG